MAGKRILRFLKGFLDMRITCCGEPGIRGYADAESAGDIFGGKSISAYVFPVGVGTLSSKSQLQNIVAASTLEAEYFSLYFAAVNPCGFQKFMGTWNSACSDYPLCQ